MEFVHKGLMQPVQETQRITARQPAKETATSQKTAVALRSIARRLLAETDDHTRQDLAHGEHRVSESLSHNENSRYRQRDYEECRTTRDREYSNLAVSTLARDEVANRVRVIPKPNGSETDQEDHWIYLARRGIAIRRTFEANQKALNAIDLQGPNWITNIGKAKIGDVIQLPHHENCMDKNMIVDTISYWWPVLGGYLISKLRWALVVEIYKDSLLVRIFTTFSNTPRDIVREGEATENSTDEAEWNLSDYLQVVSLDNKGEFNVESRCSGLLNWRCVNGAPTSNKKDSFMNISNGTYTHYNRLPFRIVGRLADNEDINTLTVALRKAAEHYLDAIDEVSKNWVPTPRPDDTPQRKRVAKQPYVDCPEANDGSANFLPNALRYDDDDSVAEPNKDIIADVQGDIKAHYSKVPESLLRNMRMNTTRGGRSIISYGDA